MRFAFYRKGILQTILFLILIFIPEKLFSQVPSVIEHIRIPLWAEMDTIPGIDEYKDDAGLFDYSVSHIKQTCPFLIEGMVYGWDFVYTPSDKDRNVEEYFELIPRVDYSYFYGKIDYVNPLIEDNKLNCWCEYTRTADEVQNYYWWSSIQNPRIHGNGYGALSKGVEGVRDAVFDAAKNAVREHYRGFVKNKPKEITGGVFIKNPPLLGVDAGRYFVKLDFLLEYGRILEYIQF